MKAVEFREMTPEERKQRLTELRERLFRLKVELATGQLQDTNQIKSIRKDIARCLTVQRELAG
jgi:large subunit ribosomal protein L29